MTDSINVNVHLIEITISFSGGFADPTPRFGNNLHLDVVLVGLKRGVKNCEWKKEVGEGIYIYVQSARTNAHRGIGKEDGRKRKRGTDDWVILCEDWCLLEKING